MAYADVIAGFSPSGYWRCGESSGTTLNDSSGNGYHGDLGSASFFDYSQTALISETDNTSLASTDNFYGGAYLTTAEAQALLLDGDGGVKSHTFCGWIQKSSYPSGGNYAGLFGLSYNFRFWINSAGKLEVYRYGIGAAATSSATVPLDEPVFVSYRYNNSGPSITFRINDTEETYSVSDLGYSGSGSAYAYLLANPDGNGSPLYGTFDELAMFPSVLSTDDLDDIYNAGLAQPEDGTPDAFSFTDATSQPLSTIVESNAITVAGINVTVAISVTGGEYQIDSGSWTSSSSTVSVGSSVKVRHTTSSEWETTTNTTLTIGGVSDTFTSTTSSEILETEFSMAGEGELAFVIDPQVGEVDAYYRILPTSSVSFHNAIIDATLTAPGAAAVTWEWWDNEHCDCAIVASASMTGRMAPQITEAEFSMTGVATTSLTIPSYVDGDLSAAGAATVEFEQGVENSYEFSIAREASFTPAVIFYSNNATELSFSIAGTSRLQFVGNDSLDRSFYSSGVATASFAHASEQGRTFAINTAGRLRAYSEPDRTLGTVFTSAGQATVAPKLIRDVLSVCSASGSASLSFTPNPTFDSVCSSASATSASFISDLHTALRLTAAGTGAFTPAMEVVDGEEVPELPLDVRFLNVQAVTPIYLTARPL